MAKNEHIIADACRLIESSAGPKTLAELAEELEISASHLHRLFKSETGLSPHAYARAHRESRLRSLLPRSQSVTEAVFRSGFDSVSRFYEGAESTLGMLPKSSKRRGAGETIRFALGRSSLGSILIAATQIGLCWISLGDDAEKLLQEFQERFQNADLIGADADFEEKIALVVGFVEDPNLGLNLPLDIRGTVFQRRVWQALGEIQLGSKCSYKELATRLGAPRSARAVAAACAANVLAVAIPCHRVIASNGDLQGYRWGVARKAELLKRELIATETANQGSSDARQVLDDDTSICR